MIFRFAISAKEIGALIDKNQLSLLVGSGVSCACGLPSWDGIVKEMKKELLDGCSKADKKDLRDFLSTADGPKIAGMYKLKKGEVSYASFLRTRLRNCSYTSAPVLKTLAKLPIKTIFTTNVDKLLETACRKDKNSIDPVVIMDPSQLPPLDGSERRIIKIHGDIDYPSSLIFTEDDYRYYDDKYESLRVFFQGHLAFSTMLLVGFGLRDSNFDRIYAGARRIVQGSGTRVIALMTNQNSFEKERWEKNGLLINNFSAYDEIPRFLSNVLRFC